MSNISSLGDMRKKDKQATSDKQNELFIGGIDQKGGGSGLAVIGPPGGAAKPPVPAPSDAFDRIFERAQDRSDEESGSSPAGSSGTRRVITMYRNGFAVDDGPFRDATLPENQLFIRSLEAGRVPPEMSRGASDDMEVSLNDKRSEDYVAPPPPAYVAFSKGTALGSSSSASGSSGAWVSSPDDAPAPAVVDESKPHSTLQIRTYDGKRLLVKLNNNATVLQLSAAIRSQWPDGSGTSFSLCSGFPPKDLCSDSQTLSEAGLVGSSVTLKKA